MLELTGDIERTLRAGAYLAATMCTLAVPDIAGALQSVDGEAKRPRYEQWYRDHVEPRGYAGWLSAEDCYLYRCSMLHQGSAKHPRNSHGRIILMEPSPITIHRNTMQFGSDTALVIDAVSFCKDVALAAKDWWSTASQDPNVVKNYEGFVRRRAEGLPPYIQGLPLIG